MEAAASVRTRTFVCQVPLRVCSALEQEDAFTSH